MERRSVDKGQMKLAHIAAVVLLGLVAASASVRFDTDKNVVHPIEKTGKRPVPSRGQEMEKEPSPEEKDSDSEPLGDQWSDEQEDYPAQEEDLAPALSRTSSSQDVPDGEQSSIGDDVLLENNSQSDKVELDIPQSSMATREEALVAEAELDRILQEGPINFSEVAFGKDVDAPIQTGGTKSILGRTPKKVDYTGKANDNSGLTHWEIEDMRKRNPGFIKARHMDVDAALVAKGLKDSNSEIEERDSEPGTWIIPDESISIEFPAWERRFSDGKRGLKYYNEWVYASEYLDSGEWSLEENILMGEEDLLVRRAGILSRLAAPPMMGSVQHVVAEDISNSATILKSNLIIPSLLLSTILLAVL